MTLAIVVPVKSPHRAKHRLASLLSETERLDLASAMARDVFRAVQPLTEYPRLVVSDDSAVLEEATRYGLDGQLIDLKRGEPYPASTALERLLEWTSPVREELGIDVNLPPLNGAQRQRRLLDAGMSLNEVYGAMVAETRDTYAPGARSPALK